MGTRSSPSIAGTLELYRQTRSFLSDFCSLNSVSLGPRASIRFYTVLYVRLSGHNSTQFHHGNIGGQAGMHVKLEIPEQEAAFSLAAHTISTSRVYAFLHTSGMRQERASLTLTQNANTR
jgi:hypothetical protein